MNNLASESHPKFTEYFRAINNYEQRRGFLSSAPPVSLPNSVDESQRIAGGGLTYGKSGLLIKLSCVN